MKEFYVSTEKFSPAIRKIMNKTIVEKAEQLGYYVRLGPIMEDTCVFTNNAITFTNRENKVTLDSIEQVDLETFFNYTKEDVEDKLAFIEGKVYKSNLDDSLVMCIDKGFDSNYFVGLTLDYKFNPTNFNTYTVDPKNSIENCQKSIYSLYTDSMLLSINSKFN